MIKKNAQDQEKETFVLIRKREKKTAHILIDQETSVIVESGKKLIILNTITIK